MSYDCSFCRKKGVAGRLGLRRMEWCIALVVQLVYDTSGAPGGRGGDGDPLAKPWTFEF